MKVLTVKDWLKERSEKQFRLLQLNTQNKCVERLKDKKWFSVKQEVKYKDCIYRIIMFSEDCVSVYIGNLKQISGIVEINKLELI